MPKYSLRSVLDWLRAGYPEGIPAKDHFALLAVLRRRLTDEEIAEVCEMSIATAHEHPERHVDYDTLKQTSPACSTRNRRRRTSNESPDTSPREAGRWSPRTGPW